MKRGKVLFFTLLFILIFINLSYAQGDNKTKVGIFYFLPQGEDIPWVRKGIAILLIDRFSQFQNLYVLPRDKFEGLSLSMFSASNVGALAKKFSLDYIAGGKYKVEGDTINVNAWVWGKSQNRFLVSFSVSGSFLDVVKKLSVSFYDAIAGTITDSIAKTLKRLPTENNIACKYLFTAVDYMDQAIKAYNGADFPSKPLWKKAIEYGEKATKEDPKFSLAYYYLGLIYSKTKWTKREADAWENYLKYSTQKEFPEEAGGLAYYRLGYSFYEKGDYERALKYLEKAIQIDPTLSKPYVYLGNIYYDQGDLDSAIFYYKKAYELSPGDQDISWLLKRAERVKEVGKEAYDYFEKGRAFFLNKDYVEAAYYLEQAVGINPSYLEAFVLLGKTYIELDDLENAKKAFLKAQELAPLNYEIKFLLDKVENQIKYGKEAYDAFDKGYNLYKEGNLDEALSYFRQAIEKNPNYDMAHDYLARIYYQLGKLDEYRKEREEMAKLATSPQEKADIYYFTGYEFFSLKKYDIAKQEFEKALTVYPGHVKAAFFIAEIYYSLKEYENAITYYTKVIDNPQGKEYQDKALYGRAWSYFFLKEYKKEISDLVRLITDFKDSPLRNTATYKLGEAYYLVGNYLDAIKYLKPFADKGEGTYKKDALYIIIASYIKAKNLKDAKAYLDKALNLYPGDEKFLELKTVLRDYAFNNKEYEILLSTLKGRRDETSLYEKIIALLELNRFDEAEFQLSRFKDKYPESKYLKDIYLAFLSTYLKSSREKAITILTYAIKEKVDIFPNIYKTYFVRGKLYFDLKQYKDAIADFKEAIKGKFENLSEAYYLLGLSYDKIKDKDNALSIFKILGERFKDTYACLGDYYVGAYYYKKKDWDKALKYYKDITLTCKKIDYLDKVHFYLGMIHYNKENYGSAIWNFKRSIKLAKSKEIKIENFYFIGKAYVKWQKPKEAKTWFEKVIKEGKGTKYYSLSQEELSSLANAPYKKAEEYILKGKYKDALSLLSKIEKNTQKKSYLMAKAYIGLKNWQKAEDILLSMLNNPTEDMYEDIVYGLSYVYFKEKKYFLLIELSKDYLKKGKFGDLGDDILYLASLSYEMLGKEDNAKKMYKKILTLFPNTPLKEKIEKRLEVLK